MWAHVRNAATATLLATALVMSLNSPVTAATTPARATGLKATPSSSSVKLTWNAAKNAKTYRICLLTNGSTNTCYRTTGHSTARTATITGLKPTGGTDYFFKVYAWNGSAVSRSARVGFNLTSGPVGSESVVPAKVTGLRAVPTHNAVTLSWRAAANAKTYRICLLANATTATCDRTTGHTTALSTTMTGLVPKAGTDYYFKVYAWNGSVRSRSDAVGFNLLPPPVVPDKVTGIKAAPTANGVTVTWNAARNARTYRLCLLTNGSTSTCFRTTGHTTARTATVTGLTPTPGRDYFVKVYAWNGTMRSRSDSVGFDLSVGKVTALSVPAQTTSTISFAWPAAINAETYELQIATNATMTSGLKRYSLAGTSTRTMAGSLVPGTYYYFRIRAVNGSAPSTFTTVGHTRLTTNPFNASIITYNLCGQDKCVTSANRMKRWSTRKPLAGAIARGTGADIIATQESHHTDTHFGTQLPGFTLAAYYSAKSLFYKTSEYTRVRWGTITLDKDRKRYAVWAELEDRSTRTNFIVSDTHLEPYKGKSRDIIREAQTKVLLSRLRAINTGNLPVVYAGDFNSNKSNADQGRYPGGYDAPDKVFGAAGIIDSFNTSPSVINRTWNSSNQAKNPPTMHSDHIDHIYLDPRITPLTWRVWISINGSGSSATYKTPFATDHNPVRTVVTIPGQG